MGRLAPVYGMQLDSEWGQAGLRLDLYTISSHTSQLQELSRILQQRVAHRKSMLASSRLITHPHACRSRFEFRRAI